MARPSTRRRAAGSARSRSSRGSSSSSSQQALLIGALGVLVLVLVVVFATNSSKARAGGDPSNGGSTGGSTAGSDARETSAPPVNRPGRPGKTPDRPAPPLTAATLAQLDDLHREAVEHYNDSVRARNGGDSVAARAAAGRAKEVLDRWQELVEPNLRWQEYADMEDWAQPAEYLELERRFQKYAELNKKVRMQGG